MIQPYSVKTAFQPLHDKHSLSKLVPSNQSKSIIKLVPRIIASDQFFRITNPFDNKTNDYYARQQLYFNFNVRHTVGVFMISERFNILTKNSLGLSYEYLNLHDSRYKATIIASNAANQSVQFQYSKKLSERTILTLFNTYNTNFSQTFTTLGFGLKHKQFNLTVKERLDFRSEVGLSYKKYINRHLKFNVHTQLTENKIKSGNLWRNIELSLTYLINKVKASISCNLARMNNVKVQVETQTSYGNVLLCNQSVENKSIVYIGLKKPNFKIAVPILIIDSVVPAILAVTAYVLGYFWISRTNKTEKHKTLEDRKKQIKLIADRANQNYYKQKNINGLLILQAYYGDYKIIQDLKLKQQNRTLYIQRQLKDSPNLIDVTVSLRFYTINSQLKLPANKQSIYGFGHIPTKNELLIIYKPAGEDLIKKRTFKQCEEIIL